MRKKYFLALVLPVLFFLMGRALGDEQQFSLSLDLLGDGAFAHGGPSFSPGFGAALFGDWPVAHPLRRGDGPYSSGSTTETSRADRPEKSSPFGATPKAAGWRQRRNSSARDCDAPWRASRARTNSAETRACNRSCTCRRTHRAAAFLRRQFGTKFRIEISAGGDGTGIAIALLHLVVHRDGFLGLFLHRHDRRLLPRRRSVIHLQKRTGPLAGNRRIARRGPASDHPSEGKAAYRRLPV